MPLTVGADPGRACLRLPALALAAVMAASVLVALWASLLGPPGAAGTVLPGCARAFLPAAAAWAYIRLLYVRLTRLTLDAAGLELRQPFARWRVGWAAIAGLTVTSPFDPTHKGGVAAGVRVRLADGTVRHIPDVLSVHRRDLVATIEEHRRRAA